MNEETPLEELSNEPTDPIIEEGAEDVVESEEGTTEVAEVEEPAKEEAPKPAKKNRFEKALKKQYWETQEAKREAKALKEENERLKEATRIKEEPDPDNYVDNDKYQEDKRLYNEQEVEAKVNQRFNQKQAEMRQAQASQEINKRTVAYVTERAAVVKDDANYREFEKGVDDVVKAYEAPEIHNAILKGGGTAMVKYFGKNPEELTDIALMAPQDRLFELGKIAAKVRAKAPKKISSAPNPVRSEKGSTQRPSTIGGTSRKKGESLQDRKDRINGR